MRPPGGGATGCVRGHTTPSCGPPRVSTHTDRPPTRQPPGPAPGPGTVPPAGLAQQVARRQTDEAPRLQVCAWRPGCPRAQAPSRPPPTAGAGRPGGLTPPRPAGHGCRLALGRRWGWGGSQQGGHPRPRGHESARFPVTRLCSRVLVPIPRRQPPGTWGAHRPSPLGGPSLVPRSGRKESRGPDPQWVALGPRQAFLVPCGRAHQGLCPPAASAGQLRPGPPPGWDCPQPRPPELLSQTLFSHSWDFLTGGWRVPNRTLGPSQLRRVTRTCHPPRTLEMCVWAPG